MENKAVLETSNAETVTISRAEYEELKAQNQWLLEQLRVIKSKQFGSSSEKASEEVIGQLSLLFNEPEVLVEEEKAAEEPAVEVRAYRTSSDAEHPIVLYEYAPGRGQEYPAAFLNGFRGYLQTDGYAGYNAVEGAIHVGCWAHVRRKFDEALRAVPKGKRSPTAEQGVAYCSQLFKLEEKFKDLSPEERKKQRLEQEKPVLDAMLAWANTRSAAPKSKLGIALTYLKNQWQTLVVYLEDGRIELSNNRAERSIKPFVISRKNFLFANTANGATGSAVMFSLIETAKENGLDPYRYLTWVLNEAPKRSITDPSWAVSLIPQNTPQKCRANAN